MCLGPFYIHFYYLLDFALVNKKIKARVIGLFYIKTVVPKANCGKRGKSMAVKNNGLIEAKSAKKDEFYTQLIDVEKEMTHYVQHFKGKTIYCNCDNPEWSAFWQYFHLHFAELGLKKLISTHYETEKPTYKMEYCGGDDNNIAAGTKTPLIGNGDFASDECVAILDEADICCTNPPFSIWRQFCSLLMKHNKKFVILGNVNTATCKEIFPYFKQNKMWFGPSIQSGDREFRVPNDYPLEAAGYREDDKGNKYIRVKGVRWFTNMDHGTRHVELPLTQKYTPAKYPKYDDYEAINISKTKDIPCDYTGVMGVPITFLDKYNPAQFDIIGIDRYVDDNPKYGKRFTINGKEIYARILIKAVKQ